MASFCIPFMTKNLEALFHMRLNIWTSSFLERRCKASFLSLSPLGHLHFSF